MRKKKEIEEMNPEGEGEEAIDLTTAEDEVPPINTSPPSYMVEIAKSGRAECKKCGEKIENKTIRIGVITEGDWGLFTRWQHLACTIFHKSLETIESIDGYQELSGDIQDIIRQRFQDSRNELDDEFQAVDPNDLVRKSWERPLEPTADLLMPLLPYQKEGLGWLVHQEINDVHGGILADEMGMGKTIQAISMMLYNRPNLKDPSLLKLWKESDGNHGVEPGRKMPRAGTLIVVPTVAIRQWQLEIARFTAEKSLSVMVYHGHDRNTSIKDIASYDVIITSYKILEIEYRKATAGTKVICRICGKKFYPEKLRVHRKFFCGESAQRSEAQARTQKKVIRVVQRTSSRDDSESEDLGSDSEKDTKGKSSAKKRKTPSKTMKSSTKSQAKSKSDILSSSSEDEVAKQKRLIKAKIEKMEANAKAKKTPSKGRGKKVEKENEESEDEITKQKRIIKEKIAARDLKRKAQLKAAREESEEEDSKEEEESPKRRSRNVKSRNGKQGLQAKTKAKKGRVEIESTSDDSDSSYSQSSESSYSDESVASLSEQSLVEQPTKKRKTKTETASVTRSQAASSKKKSVKKFQDSDDDPEASNHGVKGNKKENMRDGEVDSEVERDIAAALKDHANAIKQSGKAQSLMHEVSWFRIILDEAHVVKDRSTSTAKAVFNLISLNKWCLTGTPLQNRVGELYSLIRFLRIDPYAYYFCRSKDCSCKSLHYRFTKGRCDDCDHSVIQHYCFFNKHILNPIKRSGYVAEGRKAMLKLKQQVLDEILLRRTKLTRADDIQLPMRIVRVRQERLDEKEEDFYQALYTQSQAQFNTYLQSGTVLNNYAHIFDILMRLRQAVDHPYLVIFGEAQGNDANAARNSSHANAFTSTDEPPSPSSEEYCDLCKEPVQDETVSSCGHRFCKECIQDYINTLMASVTTGQVLCPECNQPLSLVIENQNCRDNERQLSLHPQPRRKSILNRINLSNFQSSTKMEALMEELYKMQEEDGGCKAIVFSQFVSMLELLEYRIHAGGIGCVKLVGTLTLDQREKSIRAFREDPDVRVLLISLKAGGVALNLTVASRIFLMDPWWNPAAEMQAIDRTHRIGQYRPIVATRFIIENSIEERILRLQEKKRLVFDGTVGGDASSMTKLTVDDMRFLFG